MGLPDSLLMRKNLFGIALALLALPSVNGVAENALNLPDIGDSAGAIISPQQEKALGEAFFRSLHGRYEINEDPEISEYIQSIGQKLAASSDTPAQTFHFFVVNEPDINAFAGPGGYVGVNSGLITMTESESELASVLGHEIAHVTQRHLLQTFEAAGRLSLPTAAAMLAAVLLGATTGSGALGQAAVVAAQAGATQFQINFTRDNEEEADRVGMQTLVRAGLDPRSMPEFFERLQQSTRFAGRGLPEFLRTHPVTTSRISDTRGRAEQYPYKQFPDSFGYQLAKAKLRVLTSKRPKEEVAYFTRALSRGTSEQRDVARYGLALALLAANQPEEAKTQLQNLMSRYRDYPQMHHALAKVSLDQKNYAEAAQIYAQALQRFPGNPALLLENARTLLILKRSELARQQIAAFLLKQKPTPDAYELMAQAYSQLGNEAESHRYLAEAYYADGQLQQAILQFRIAQRSAGSGNYYTESVIDERLAELLAEEKELRKNR